MRSAVSSNGDDVEEAGGGGGHVEEVRLLHAWIVGGGRGLGVRVQPMLMTWKKQVAVVGTKKKSASYMRGLFKVAGV